jgi:uncharacterized protein YqjF (DUF2071 family)
MHSSLRYTDHRPWPHPPTGWVMRQTWADLAFVHWEIDASQLRQLIPPSLEIDTFDGSAWIGLVPFDMRGVTPRYVPAVSALSDFPEINVRTYVTYKGKPGVWFFSLDVPNPLAVVAARGLFHLPYFLAKMQVSRQGERVDYSARYDQRVFEASYEPKPGEPIRSMAFARWATERYCLYAAGRKGQLYRGEIHHRQWPLEVADLEVRENTYLRPFAVKSQHPEVLFSRSIDVVVWPLGKLRIEN